MELKHRGCSLHWRLLSLFSFRNMQLSQNTWLVILAGLKFFTAWFCWFLILCDNAFKTVREPWVCLLSGCCMPKRFLLWHYSLTVSIFLDECPCLRLSFHTFHKQKLGGNKQMGWSKGLRQIFGYWTAHPQLYCKQPACRQLWSVWSISSAFIIFSLARVFIFWYYQNNNSFLCV